MPRRARSLPGLIAKLTAHHGELRPPSRDPWHLILLENVVYLVDDAVRQRAFARLKQLTDLDADTIARCPDELLAEACGHGRMAANQIAKLRRCAELFLSDGDPRELIGLPPAKAGKALRRYPGIGAPGAERMLLFAGRDTVLALDSNALRVLLRLGYGTEAKSYATSYRSAQTAAMSELPAAVEPLIEAHLVLQQHGRTICRNSNPSCAECPLRRTCPSRDQPPAMA
ncbi:MAG: hypothetical protein KDC98_21595 [Planctomycetes bacterium]|nr:hypothetical protein [Planctomycetota bacterium]